MSKLPPWDHRGVKRLQDQMKAWVEDELNKISWPDLEKAYEKTHSPENIEKFEAWFFALGPQIAAAERGDIKPLRAAVAKKHPELLPFIHLPPRRRGMRFHKPRNADRVDLAVNDARLIREIWQKNYGKRNRPRGDPVTAETIAAELWDVSEDDIRQRMKKTSAKSNKKF